MPESNGQPSPIGDIALTTSVLELSANSILYSYQEKGAWELGMMSMGDTHAYICNMFLSDEEQLVSPPEGLTIEVRSEQVRITSNSYRTIRFVSSLCTKTS